MSIAAPVSEKPVMAVHAEGSGPPLVMLHGGFGCWRHWIRNVGPLSKHFTVHAFDLPCYGESAPVPKELPGEDYLEIVYREIDRLFPGPQELRFVGFSFGGAISTYLAGRLKERVSRVALISPGGFPPRKGGFRNMMSYKAAQGDEALMTKTIRHNLELELIHNANDSKFRFSGDGLVPPGLDPARVRTEIEAHCATFARQQ